MAKWSDRGAGGGSECSPTTQQQEAQTELLLSPRRVQLRLQPEAGTTDGSAASTEFRPS